MCRAQLASTTTSTSPTFLWLRVSSDVRVRLSWRPALTIATSCWPELQRPWQTSCNASSTLLRVFSAAHGNLTAACRRSVLLARHSWADRLQAWCHDVRMPARKNTAAPSELLHASVWRSCSTTSTVLQSSSSWRRTTPAEHIRSTGFLCRRSVSLEFYWLSSGIRTLAYRKLQTIVKDMAVLKVLAHPAH